MTINIAPATYTNVMCASLLETRSNFKAGVVKQNCEFLVSDALIEQRLCSLLQPNKLVAEVL